MYAAELIFNIQRLMKLMIKIIPSYRYANRVLLGNVCYCLNDSLKLRCLFKDAVIPSRYGIFNVNVGISYTIGS